VSDSSSEGQGSGKKHRFDLHKYEPWQVLLVAFVLGNLYTVVMLGLGLIVLRRLGVGGW